VDYFVIPNVTIGAVVGLSTRSGRAATTAITLGARAGYNLQLGDRFSLWPTAGLNFAHFSTSDNGGSDSSTYFNLDVPFLFHVVPHFFLGIGPFLHVGLGDGDPNVLGIQSLIGGWF
jgi:opacity protein-like surface antigen